jgi:hypothetical protein
MNVAVWEHFTFDCDGFRSARIYYSLLALKILCELPFAIVGLKMPSSFGT